MKLKWGSGRKTIQAQERHMLIEWGSTINAEHRNEYKIRVDTKVRFLWNVLQLTGLGSDSGLDLGFGVGLNLSRLCNPTVGGLAGSSNSTTPSGLLGGVGSDSQTNAEIFQRLSQMLENSADLNGMAAEPASKRNYQG